MSTAKYISLGVLTRPFGLRGEVRFLPHNPATSCLDRAEGVWVREGGGEPKYFRLISWRRHQEFFLLSLEGVRDCDAAAELRGREVVAPEDSLPAPAADEFYWYQLVGLRVEDPAGQVLGEVVRIEETAPELDGNDLVVVKGAAGELILPATADAIKEINLAAGKIVVSPEFLIGPG